jgi:hypothetical protein
MPASLTRWTSAAAIGVAINYPFTIVELRLNAEGEGEGKLSFATKITADKESGTIVLENYDIQPALLLGVKREETT